VYRKLVVVGSCLCMLSLASPAPAVVCVPDVSVEVDPDGTVRPQVEEREHC